ncbi:hypothetical protein AB4Z54_39060, partial [Streptomyces sp. MCAF7]
MRAAVTGALAVALLGTAATAPKAHAGDGTAAKTGGRVDFGQRLQPIDGFGFSQAFQRADVMHAGLPARRRHA